MLDFQVSCRTMHLNFNSFKLECVLQQQIANICQICALSNNLNKGDGKPCGGIQPAQQLFWNLLLISNIANIQYFFLKSETGEFHCGTSESGLNTWNIAAQAIVPLWYLPYITHATEPQQLLQITTTWSLQITQWTNSRNIYMNKCKNLTNYATISNPFRTQPIPFFIRPRFTQGPIEGSGSF